ncbi:MAG: DNA primase [Acidobacteria bacterium]|nr:DNA primase [Acidobacteriota bacterium]
MDFKDHVKSSVDIVRVVGDYVRLKKSGSERWVGLCPFHSEKTPSFSVQSRLQIYKCFGCGKSGDVFNFVMEHQGLSFYEALTLLAEQHGIPVPQRREGPQADAETKRREALHAMHDIAQRHFAQQLNSPAGREALAYLERRQLNRDDVERFGLGYAPSGNRLLSIFRREGFADEHMAESGLVDRSAERGDFYDFFRDRLMFPISSQAGKVIAFGGRALRDDQQPKYLNSRETPVYNKSAVLYNLNRAKEAMRKENRVVLVEGYMDVIGVARTGVGEIVATCGTRLTPDHVRVLRRLVDHVVVNFDSDRAGVEAAERSVGPLLKEGFAVRVLELPGGLDPDEYCREHGPDAYRARLDDAPSYFVWLEEQTRRRFDLATPEGRAEAFRYLLPSIQLLPDKVQRAAIAQNIAERMRVDRGLILEEFRRAAVERDRRPPPVASSPLSHGERLLVELFLDSAEARAEMLERTAESTSAQRMPGAAIFATMLTVAQSGETFEFSALDARLEPRDRESVAAIVFDRDRREVSIEEGRQAVGAIERLRWEREYRQVRREIAEAERSGDREKSLTLLQRKVELERRLGMGRGSAG